MVDRVFSWCKDARTIIIGLTVEAFKVWKVTLRGERGVLPSKSWF